MYPVIPALLRPVERVNWHKCIAFCNELTKQAGLGESECLYYSDAGYTKVYTKEDAGAKKRCICIQP